MIYTEVEDSATAALSEKVRKIRNFFTKLRHISGYRRKHQNT